MKRYIKHLFTVKTLGAIVCLMFFQHFASAQCTPDFTYTTGSNGRCYFTNTSTGSYTNQSWLFGDGSGSNASNPVITYAHPGTYTVMLAIYCSGQWQTVFKSVTITTANSNCDAYFTFVRDSSDTSLFHFIPVTGYTAPATTFIWSFGDGDSSGLKYPSHKYTPPFWQSGYYVSLKIVNGTDTCTKVFYDTLFANNSLQAGIKKQAEQKATMLVYPVPAKDELTVQLMHTTGQPVWIRIVDIMGKEYMRQEYQTEHGSTRLQINTRELKDGIFLVEVISENTRFMQRISKSRF